MEEPMQKDPFLACFKPTDVLGTDDSASSFPIKKPDNKYVLGTQRSTGALIQSHTKR